MREPDASAEIRTKAISMERAIESKFVEVKPLATKSTRTEMALLFKPLHASQPWIRIDPGWVLQKPELSGVALITTQTVYVRLPRQKNFEVRVRQVSLRPTGSLGVPSNPDLVRIGNEALISFLRDTGNKPAEPPWKIVQIAVWAIAGNVPYDKVKPPTKGSHHGFRGNNHYATAGQIAQVAELLTEAGLDPNDYAVWKEMNAELDGLVAAYEEARDDSPERALEPFKSICNFYPLSIAADIMVSAFDHHDGAKGKEFRSYVVKTLFDYGTLRELEVLQERAGFESDPEVLKEMNQAIEALKPLVAAPAK